MDEAGRTTALTRLEEGHRRFARSGSAGERYTIEIDPASVDSTQAPFAAVLSCADARVPVELIFGQTANDLFVVRVAGAVPGAECLGSLHFAVDNLASVELVTVLGHSQCGAVSAAADALLNPRSYLGIAHTPALRAIVDALLAGVRMADLALRDEHGNQVDQSPDYRRLLIETAVVANTAITAAVLARALTRPVTFGVFDLSRRSVGHYRPDGWSPRLRSAPAEEQELEDLLRDTVRHQPAAG